MQEDQAQPLPENVRPGSYNINPYLVAKNVLDDNNNPTGGEVKIEITKEVNGGVGQHNCLQIHWQDGPRANEDGSLAGPNGAFVEDVIYAALQRLEFFQASQFKSEYNERAITGLKQALEALYQRSNERDARGVLGKHEA